MVVIVPMVRVHGLGQQSFSHVVAIMVGLMYLYNIHLVFSMFLIDIKMHPPKCICPCGCYG